VLNLVGGAVLVAILSIEGALPQGALESLGTVAEEIAAKTPAATFARALLAGALLTLLSYLLHAVSSVVGRILVAYMAGFLVALGPFDHVVVSGLHVLFGIFLGHGVTWADLGENAAIATAGNLIGGGAAHDAHPHRADQGVAREVNPEDYTADLKELATGAPEIAKLVSVGKSVEGRDLAGIEIGVSADYGVPQLRRRMLFLAQRTDIGPAPDAPPITHCPGKHCAQKCGDGPGVNCKRTPTPTVLELLGPIVDLDV
jgi:hypothetical protein